MNKYKYIMGCFIIAMNISGSLAANSLISNKINNLPRQWNDVLFRPWFYNEKKINGSSIHVWKKDTAGRSSFILKDKLTPITKNFQQYLFSNQTLNPFRKIYSDVYTPKAKKAFKKCDFVGIQFELDDRTETQEWYIAAPIETCLYGKKALGPIPAGDNSEMHYWILQKDSHNQYKILMESEGLLTVTNIKQQGYKQLKTQMFNQHVYRDKADRNTYPLQSCGGARIIWKFTADKYQPVELYAATAHCDRGYDEMMHPYERGELLGKQLEEVVKPQVLGWLNRLSQEPLTVDWKSGKVLPAKKANQQNKLSPSAFTAEEIGIINSLLH